MARAAAAAAAPKRSLVDSCDALFDAGCSPDKSNREKSNPILGPRHLGIGFLAHLPTKRAVPCFMRAPPPRYVAGRHCGVVRDRIPQAVRGFERILRIPASLVPWHPPGSPLAHRITRRPWDSSIAPVPLWLEIARQDPGLAPSTVCPAGFASHELPGQSRPGSAPRPRIRASLLHVQCAWVPGGPCLVCGLVVFCPVYSTDPERPCPDVQLRCSDSKWLARWENAS